jgi:hypothetical protein
MSLILLEVISYDEFIEKCIECMCELEGESFYHDILVGGNPETTNRRKYDVSFKRK